MSKQVGYTGFNNFDLGLLHYCKQNNGICINTSRLETPGAINRPLVGSHYDIKIQPHPLYPLIL